MFVRAILYVGFITNDIIFIIHNVRAKETQYKEYALSTDLVYMETTFNGIQRTKKWNMRVSHWLGECFYLFRIENYNSSKNLAIFITFVASLTWHGFFIPGFFILYVNWIIGYWISKYRYKNNL